MPSTTPFPDELKPFHLTNAVERRRRIRRCMVRGYLVWKKGEVSLVEAMRDAAGVDVVGEYALIEMRRMLLTLNLHEWERHPARLRAEVHSLFRRTIGRLTPHRGGWRVHAVH